VASGCGVAWRGRVLRCALGLGIEGIQLSLCVSLLGVHTQSSCSSVGPSRDGLGLAVWAIM
jgi:hypothetical protein